MALIQPPLDMQNRTDHTAANDRGLLDLFTAGIQGLSAAAATNLVRASSVPDMNITIARERFMIPGTESTSQGKYFAYNDGDLVRTVSASSPSLPRIDIVVAYVRDQVYSTTFNQWDIDIIAGTPNASPVAAAAPNNSIVLANIAVAATVTTITNANITINSSLLRTNAPGGTPPVPGSAAYPASPFIGQQVLDLGLGWEVYWNGATWVTSDGGFVAPRIFTNQAAVPVAFQVAGCIVYLSAPTGANYSAGLYRWHLASTTWQPVNVGINDANAIQMLLFTPGANTDTAAAGTATWLTLGNVTVPVWATRCSVVYTLNGIYDNGTTASVTVVVKIGSATGAVSKRLLSPGVASQRFHQPMTDLVTAVPTGVQSVTISSSFGAGTLVRADTTSFITATFTFMA